jgi:type IV fimbrial biogenesis protein FimT
MAILSGKAMRRRSIASGRRCRGASGFTLVELMIVMVILGILLSVGLPAFSDFMRMQRVKNATFEVFSTLVYARSEAVSRNAAVTVTPAGGTWASGWQVTAGVTVLRTQGAYPNITITGPNSITFNGNGRLAAAVSGIQIEAPSQAGTERCITLDLSGRPVSKPYTCS